MKASGAPAPGDHPGVKDLANASRAAGSTGTTPSETTWPTAMSSKWAGKGASSATRCDRTPAIPGARTSVLYLLP